MPVSDQPSILTVCLTDEESSDRFGDELANLLAERRGLAPLSPSGGGHRKDDPCDDSACGIDLSDGSLSGTTNSTAGRVEGTGGATASFFHADSGKKAIELLRVLQFDLLVTGDQLPDMAVGQLIRRVRAAWPWQKWALVGSQITHNDEIAARTLGAMAVFDAPADWHLLAEVADGIRSRAVATAMPALNSTAGKASISVLPEEARVDAGRSGRMGSVRQRTLTEGNAASVSRSVPVTAQQRPRSSRRSAG